MHHYQLDIPLKMTFYKEVLFLTALSLALTSCSSPISRISKHVEKNVLTGVPGANGHVLAAKIDDTPEAHPQIGLRDADVIYIEQVEGGLTRLAAIYTSKYPENIGPVRSARISDLDILAQYGRVAFAYSGAQSKFLPKIRAANLVDLGAEHEPPAIYYRDETRSEPTNLILKPIDLLAKAKNEGANIAFAKSVGWQFGESPTSGEPIKSAKVIWPASNYTFTWSDLEKRWLIDYHRMPDLDSTGYQLGDKTILIQLVSITDSEYRDKAGGITPFSNTIGVGFGYLLRDGKAFKINWKRDNADSGTSFFTADGKAAYFKPGQIWIALASSEPIFTYLNTGKSSDTGTVLSK